MKKISVVVAGEPITCAWDHPPVRQIYGYVKNYEIWRLAEPRWRGQWVYRGQERNLDVFENYLWDGASIPRLGWTILGLTPGGLMGDSSLPHDAPYRAKGGRKPGAWAGCRLTNNNGNEVTVERREVDIAFIGFSALALSIDSVFSRSDARKCAVMFPIIRAGGAFHWGGPMPAIK